MTGISPDDCYVRIIPMGLFGPELLGAQRIGIAIDPGFGFHEAAAFRATLRGLNKEGTVLAGLVALLSCLAVHKAILGALLSYLYSAFEHLTSGSINLSLLLGLLGIHDIVMALLGPGRHGAGRQYASTTKDFRGDHLPSRKDWARLPIRPVAIAG